MFASFFLTYGLNVILKNENSFSIYKCLLIFTILILLSLTIILLSSHLLYLRKRKESITITFQEDLIDIYWLPKEINETKDWNYIKKCEEEKNAYYIYLNVWSTNIFILPKSSLTTIENEKLGEWLRKNRKLKD